MRGRPPTPTKLLAARGSRHANRPGEPEPPVRAPSCPEWLPDVAKTEWQRVVDQLLALGLVAELDRALLTIYCEAWAEYVAVCDAIRQLLSERPPTPREPTPHPILGEELNGLVLDLCRRLVSAPSGYPELIASGLLNARNKAVDRLNKIAQQFGFSPAARARLKVDPEQGSDDGFQVFLNRANPN